MTETFYYKNNNISSTSKHLLKPLEPNATIRTSATTGLQNPSNNFTTEEQNTGQQYLDSDNSDSSQLQTQPIVAIDEILTQNNNLLKAEFCFFLIRLKVRLYLYSQRIH